MNSSKARDFFSAYREGTLDAGLREAFERQMAADERLQEEFARFCSALEFLESGRDEQIEVPFDLHDRISRAVDRKLWHEKRSAPAGMGVWLRSLAYGGVATLAIIGAIATLQNPRSSEQVPAGMVNGPGTAPSLTVQDGELRLQHSPSRDRIVILDGGSGVEIWRAEADGHSLDVPLLNRSAKGKLIEITVGDRSPMRVVVPGTSALDDAPGTGSIDDFAIGLSDRYGLPVQVLVADPTRTLEWDLESAEALAEARKFGKPLGLTVELRDSGVLILSD